MTEGRTINLRRGYDIKLVGAAGNTIENLPLSPTFTVKPDDFRDLIPKLMVQPGDDVKAGQPLFYDKLRPEIRICAPVSGEVAEIIRGEKRKIMGVRILVDKGAQRYEEFGVADAAKLDRTAIQQRLLDSGAWSYIRQRPYSIVANPADTPKAIFVSCFDSAPLAPDLSFVIGQDADNFKAGLDALRVLANGNLNLGARPGQEMPGADKATVHRFSGPHPAGNVGIQIHHVNPIRKGEVVWYVHPQDVILIGRLFQEGHYRPERLINIAGEGVTTPQYLRVTSGQEMDSITNGRVREGKYRVIQGNILTGKTSGAGEALSFYENQVTVLPEGDEPEFLGWLLPGFGKLSLSRTFFSWLSNNKIYHLDTNMHGEERNFVMSGEYEKVLPMDILPVFLLKSIMARDVDRMEQLGIYEIAEEDFALCEFVCTSKIDVQQIVAEGLDYIRKEA